MASAKKLNITPAPGLLLLEPSEKETKTASGIYLPETAGEKPQQGTIIAIGADSVSEQGVKQTSPAKVGDRVIYKKWGANEVKHEGKEYLFLKFDDVLAIIK